MYTSDGDLNPNCIRICVMFVEGRGQIYSSLINISIISNLREHGLIGLIRMNGEGETRMRIAKDENVYNLLMYFIPKLMCL